MAAGSGVHRDPPRGGGWKVTTIRGFADYRCELGEQQSENGLVLAMGPAAMLGVVRGVWYFPRWVIFG